MNLLPTISPIRHSLLTLLIISLLYPLFHPSILPIFHSSIFLNPSVYSEEVKSNIDFEKHVLPILQKRCFSCHSAPKTNPDGTTTQPKGGVQLDSVKGIQNSSHGEVIVAGKPADSLLYQRITLPETDTGIMPPAEEGEPLTEAQTDLIQKWIEQGATFGNWIGNLSQQSMTEDGDDAHQPSIMPPITDLVLTKDGKSVIASSQAGLMIYEYPTLKLQRTIKAKAHNIHDIAFSPDGELLAIGGGNPSVEGTIEILSWSKGRSLPILKILKGHRDSVTAISWRDSSTIASGGLDKQIILWDIHKEKQIQVFKGHSKGVSSLCFLNDNNTLVSTGIDQNVRVWNVTTGELLRSLNNHTMSVHDLALRPNNSGLPMIASASDDQTVRFWQPSIGRMVKFARVDAPLLNVAWLNDGSKVAAASNDGHVYIINPETVEVDTVLPAIDGWVYSLIVHPTNSDIIVGGANGQIKRLVVD